jgi:hypothetical protein
MEAKKENLFEKYPDVEMRLDAFDAVYKIKYTECIKERGAIRFERKEKIVSKEKIQKILSELLDG